MKHTFSEFLSSSDSMIFNYRFIKKIGESLLSEIYLVQNTDDGQDLVGKVYHKHTFDRYNPLMVFPEESPFQRFLDEISIFKKLLEIDTLSGKICNLVELLDDELTNTFIIIMNPYCPLGSLTAFQRQFDSGNIPHLLIKGAFFQFASTLNILHANNIAHRDINPENLLVKDRTHFVVTDFNSGSIIKEENEFFEDTKGCLPYLSPEECSGSQFLLKPTDVWAYGVTLYKMIYNKLPFNLDEIFQNAIGTITVLTLLDVYTNGNTKLEFPNIQIEDFDPKVIPLIQQLLNFDPQKRPTFEIVVQHPWFDEVRNNEAFQ